MRGGDAGRRTPAPAASASSTGSTTVAAATVRLVAATNGSCSMRRVRWPGRAVRARPGRPRARPDRRPVGCAVRRPGRSGERGGFGAFGKVTAVVGRHLHRRLRAARRLRRARPPPPHVTVTTTSAHHLDRREGGDLGRRQGRRCVVEPGQDRRRPARSRRRRSRSVTPVNGACTSGMFGGGVRVAQQRARARADEEGRRRRRAARRAPRAPAGTPSRSPGAPRRRTARPRRGPRASRSTLNLSGTVSSAGRRDLSFGAAGTRAERLGQGRQARDAGTRCWPASTHRRSTPP